MIVAAHGTFDDLTVNSTLSAPNGTFPSLGTDGIINADENLDTIGFHAHLSMEEKEIKNVSKITVGDTSIMSNSIVLGPAGNSCILTNAQLVVDSVTTEDLTVGDTSIMSNSIVLGPAGSSALLSNLELVIDSVNTGYI